MSGVSVVSPPATAEVAVAESGGTLRVIELQLVAFIMVFSAASGLVPLIDLFFPAFTTAYILALSRLAFPVKSRAGPGRRIFAGEEAFRAAGATVGLFLPLAYVLGGFARGDHRSVGSATPHLFLLSCQVLTENIIAAVGATALFSPPVRALVPLLYTVRRIFLLIDWLVSVWVTHSLPANAHFKEVAWSWFGRSLATVNVVYFTFNLLCFLIPRVLPTAFYNYFVEKDDDNDNREMLSKMSQDNNKSYTNIPPFSLARDKKLE